MIWGSNFLETTNCMFSMSSWVCRSGSNSSLMFWQEAMRYNLPRTNNGWCQNVDKKCPFWKRQKTNPKFPPEKKKQKLESHPIIPSLFGHHGHGPMARTQSSAPMRHLMPWRWSEKTDLGKAAVSCNDHGDFWEESHDDLEIVYMIYISVYPLVI